MKEKQKKARQRLYCKEKNLLQLPVFYFEKLVGKEVQISWEEEDGRQCKILCLSSRGIPGSLEQDVYAACMQIWVTQGMPDNGIEVQYSDIAKALNLDPAHWRSPIKKSLLKLGAARYEFTECFIDAKKKAIERIVQFSLFDTTEFQAERKKGGTWNKNRLHFPDEIKVNLEQRYYQWLDFETYMSIKSGVPRRLYEFLEKRRYHGVEGTFSIGEEKLFRWIPLTDKNISSRRKTLRDAAEAVIEVDYLESYSWDKKSKVFHFTYGKEMPRMAIDKNTIPKEPVTLKAVESLEEETKEAKPGLLDGLISKEVAEKNIQQQEKKENALREEHIKILFDLLKKKIGALKKAITRYYDENGYDYVLWNIRYANANAKMNYPIYLKGALEGNWALEWKEEKVIEVKDAQRKREEQEKEQKEQENKQKERERIARDQDLFIEKYESLPEEVKSRLWNQAEAEIPQDKIGRAMLVRFSYTDLVRQYVNEGGENFTKETVRTLKHFV